jgi:hypothetical protein
MAPQWRHAFTQEFREPMRTEIALAFIGAVPVIFVATAIRRIWSNRPG